MSLAVTDNRPSFSQTLNSKFQPLTSNPDLLIVIGITLLAAALRLWRLDAIPPGLHGDEALTGLDAQRIQREGWIGPYVGSALGQPTGPLYWTALVLRVFGDGAFNVRLSMALLGIATIPMAYVAVRQMYDRRVALIATALLAVMTWHLAFSRTAFMVISWPLMELIVIGLLFAALKRASPWLFAAGGLALGLGIYSYNVYPLFIVVIAVFAGLYIVQHWPQRLRLVTSFALMFTCSLIIALPLLLYAADSDKGYFSHHKIYSLFNTPAYKEADLGERIDILATRTADWLGQMFWREQPDGVDATGTRPMLDWLSVALVAGGLALALSRIRDPANQLLVLMLLFLPIASIVSIDGGFRRSLGLAPVLAIFAALPLAWLWQRARTFAKPAVAKALVVGAVVVFGLINLRVYFEEVGDSQLAAWVYAEEIAEASKYLDALPESPYVYFYSDRWSFHYETRRYLAPDAQGEDRSQQFGRNHGFEVDRAGDILFLLLPPYYLELEYLQRLYPEGRTFVKREGRETIFAVFHLTEDGQPAASAETSQDPGR
jgi:4-amino-4-deoxy-L-arabinose transferase-like glycosyltransferase